MSTNNIQNYRHNNKNGIIYGYIRVSTVAQHDDRQWAAMEEFCVSKEHIFVNRKRV